jgi:hypothetical protein
LKKVFQTLDLRNYRYSIKVPITKEEREMFDCSVSAIEFQMGVCLDIIAEGFDRNTNPKASFIRQGCIPSDDMGQKGVKS